LRLGFVVQRYGLDIAGGAEYHCRLIAEHMARHAQVEVLTTCATDYITWGNHYPEGVETLNGITVRRFRVKRPRDVGRFAEWSARVLGLPAEGGPRRLWPTGPGPAAGPGEGSARTAGRSPLPPSTEGDQLRWLEEEGPLSKRLVEHVEARRRDFDFFVFFSYRYYTTYHGLRVAPERSLLVPTAEDDGVYRLGIFREFFRLPRAIVYNSHEERAMIQGASGNATVAGDVVGVGSALPGHLEPEAFRGSRGVDGPFLLYVGRIDENKGCRELFSFFRRYRAETGSRMRLVLVGKPVLPIPDDPNIVTLGFLSDAEKWNALAACDALVMPSRYESLSMVTLEAWWAGRPVLANGRCDVLRGQCQRSNAGLYYSTYEEFRETLGLLEANPGLRRDLGENGRRYFETHYAWDVVEKKYLDLFARAREAPPA
jgi:glycosyltransferase involved in cell wall biosynthesis